MNETRKEVTCNLDLTNSEQKEIELDSLIGSFYTKKEKLDNYKKETDIENRRIKELMTELNITEYENTFGKIAKMSITTKETFNEPALIEKLNELNLKEAIKLVPQIDWDVVEDLIYNGKLNAAELTPFKEEKEVVTLRVTQKKGE